MSASNRTGGNRNQGPDMVNCRDGFGINGCSNLSGTIQLGHAQNSNISGIAPVNHPSLVVSLGQQNKLLQQYPEVGQLQQRIQTPRPGNGPLNSLIMERMHHQLVFNGRNYPPISPRPNHSGAFTGIASQLPSYGTTSELRPAGPQRLGHACNQQPFGISNKQPVGISIDVDVSQCPKVSNGVAIDMSSTTPHDSVIETVQNFLPGHYEREKLPPYDRRSDLELAGKMSGGVSLDMQTCDGDYFLGSGLLAQQPLAQQSTLLSIWKKKASSSAEVALQTTLMQR
ncbi:uncharacterized protein LOC143854241 [Tasmannia lanceolata]|uniref:uncharacterized protein LOC143854241 n=1 Tax=Tasmannia lanceolata TaxID=3420 RepID=UPI004062840F